LNGQLNDFVPSIKVKINDKIREPV